METVLIGKEHGTSETVLIYPGWLLTWGTTFTLAILWALGEKQIRLGLGFILVNN